ncbi:MAG: Lrp/AsnC family transcriptional regulator [Lachnospiraceae bacterium]|jgi:DNA-binding Lrp family transcriptional regulator|nr:Lrp/AsnC family transcriptional regulator [Lachnospiraceae bacterium]MBP5532535.1 Lrp/AsnC family transcriptional regulator [Lachnospiraceae bacterium]MCR4993352.1 Lrp/AsnC family transcriptional regulator [Lachnospiraceae bacterium]
MNELKEKILRAIAKDSKIATEELAIRLGCTKEELITAIAEMEADKVICGYPTLIDWDKVSEEKVTALIELKVTPQRGQGFDKIAERIYKFDEVESVYLMSGGFDLTVIIRGKSMKEVSRFVFEKLAPMESIQSTATHFVLKKYKDQGLIMQFESDDERIQMNF